MVEYLEKFPTYEELKSLDKNKEYIYKFSNIVGGSYYRFTYNEDHSECISFDYIDNGYLSFDSISKNIRKNELHKLNKVNYNNICKEIKYTFKYLEINFNNLKKQIIF